MKLFSNSYRYMDYGDGKKIKTKYVHTAAGLNCPTESVTTDDPKPPRWMVQLVKKEEKKNAKIKGVSKKCAQ
jgi:ABC-type metal ion transport system substrate-binding protein